MGISTKKTIMMLNAFAFFTALASQSALAGPKSWTLSGLRREVNYLAIAPSNPNIAFASLVSDGGIFKTNDGGRSWTQVLDGLVAGALGIHPLNPNMVIAAAYFPATKSPAVMKTTDGGRIWAPIDYVPFSHSWDYVSVRFHPTYPDIIDIVERTHLYRSSDGGKQWTDRPSPVAEIFFNWYEVGSFQELVVDPENPDILFSVIWDWIFESTDGGYSWSEVVPFIDIRTCVTSLAIDPKNPKVMWAGTSNGIGRSVDGGATWKLVNRDVRGVYHFAVDPIVPDNIYAAEVDRVRRSTDGGITWSDMSAGLVPDFIRSLEVHPQNPQLLYAATVSGVYSYSAGSHVSTLYFPRLATAGAALTNPEYDEHTGIALVNVDSEDAGLTLTAYSPDGSLILGDGITNPAMRFVRAGAQMAIMDSELWGSGWAAAQRVGWFTVDSTARIAGYSATFNQSLSAINGAGAESESLKSILFTEIAAMGFTRIYLANPNVDPAMVSVELVDRNGRVKGSVSRKIKPDGALMELISSLFPGIESEPSDYVRVSSDQGVIPFEITDKPGQSTHALNGQNASSGATTLYCQQYLAGGTNWSTSLSIVNPSDKEATAALRLIGDDGNQIGPTHMVTIPKGGKALIADQALLLSNAAVETRGYLRIESLGPSAPPLIGSMSFGGLGNGSPGMSLPFAQRLATDFVLSQVASNRTWWTGITLVNQNDSAATMTLELRDKSGSLQGVTNLVLPSGHRVSRLLTEYFKEVTGKDLGSGFVRVVSDKGLAAVAAFGTNSLSVFTAVPVQSIR